MADQGYQHRPKFYNMPILRLGPLLDAVYYAHAISICNNISELGFMKIELKFLNQCISLQWVQGVQLYILHD